MTILSVFAMETLSIAKLIEQKGLKVGDLCLAIVESIHEEHDNMWAICKTLEEFDPPLTIWIDRNDMCKRNGHMKKVGEHIVVKISGTPGIDHHSGLSIEMYHGQFKSVTPEEMRAYKKYNTGMKKSASITKKWLIEAEVWPILTMEQRRMWIEMLVKEGREKEGEGEKEKDREEEEGAARGGGGGGARRGKSGKSEKSARDEREEEEEEETEKPEHCIYPLLRIMNLADYEQFYHEELSSYPPSLSKWANMLEEKYTSIYGEHQITEIRTIFFLSFRSEGQNDVECMLEKARECSNSEAVIERTDVTFPSPGYRFCVTGGTHEGIASVWENFVSESKKILKKHYEGHVESLQN